MEDAGFGSLEKNIEEWEGERKNTLKEMRERKKTRKEKMTIFSLSLSLSLSHSL